MSAVTFLFRHIHRCTNKKLQCQFLDQLSVAGFLGEPLLLRHTLLFSSDGPGSSNSPNLRFALAVLPHIYSFDSSFDAVVWNSAIRGYEQNGNPWGAFYLYCRMSHHNVVPDNYTYPFVLKACANSASLEQGAQVHCRIIKSPHTTDIYIECYLVDMYAKCHRINSSRAVFDNIRRKNVFCWNVIIAGYAKNGDMFGAAELFDEMPRRDLFSWNTMIDGYAKCGEVKSARKLFDEMETRDVITWNSMIDGYVRSGDMEAAKKLFVEMPIKDGLTWGVILNGYVATTGDEVTGVQMMHGLFEKLPYKNTITWNSLISTYVRANKVSDALTLFESMGIRVRNSSSWNTMLYGLVKSGDIRVAEKLFKAMPVKDSISWNIMSVGYREKNEFKNIIELFHSMTTTVGAGKISADCATLVIALSAVGVMTLYDDGRLIHEYLKKNRITTDGVVGVALLDMYFKCGYPDMAFETFHAISHESRTIDHWNGIITGAANHGLGTLAMKLFTKMVGKVRPDEITFIALLKACNHAGLIREGFVLFDLMSTKYGITPTVQHYGCLIDLLGRAGLLEEAEEIARKMPWKTNDVIWRSLLGSSRHHNDVVIAEISAKRLVEMMPRDSSSYVLMSHIYWSTGQRENHRDVLKEMKKKGVVKKVPGFSSVRVESNS